MAAWCDVTTQIHSLRDKPIIRTQYENGQWSTGGAGSGDVFTASRGRREVRAKFPKAKGVGYAFLLWPAWAAWPPEIDFAEGRHRSSC